MPRKGEPSLNKDRSFPAETYTGEEVDLLIGQCSPRCPTGCRNRALIACLRSSGLRISEVLALSRDDLEPIPAGAHLKIRHGKGDKERMGAIDLKAFALLQLWLEKKKALKIGGPIFSTLKGKPMWDTYCRTMFQRIAAKAGITKRVHPHAFRHSCAVGLLKAGKNVVEIQKVLGHGSLTTTATYLDHLLPVQALEAVTSTPW